MTAAIDTISFSRRRRPTHEEEVEILRDTLTKALISHPPAGPPRQPPTHNLGMSAAEERDAMGSRSLLAALLHRAILDYLMGYTYTGTTRGEQQLRLAQDAEDWLWCRGGYRTPQGITSAPAVCHVLKVDLGWVRRQCVAKLAALRDGEPMEGNSLSTAVRNRRRAGHAAPGRMVMASRRQRS